MPHAIRQMRPSALRTLLLAAVLTGAQVRAEEIVVIVNPAAAPISREQIADLYLARSNAWVPIDQSVGSSIYLEFYKKATGRDLAQIKAIWSRILFTGRGLPPKQMPSSAAVKKAVAADPKAVGYIERSAVDASVKVALALD
jgi:ABC-type phosphate transport system substrate-binding protein